MLKKILVILACGLFILGVSRLSLAMMCGGKMEMAQAQSTQEPASEKAVDVGNKVCPVSGEKIDEKLKATYEYKGKIYNFCCPMCIDEFKKDPEKYLKKVEEELRSESGINKEGVEGADAKTAVSQSMPEGHQH